MRKANLFIGKHDWLVRVYIGTSREDVPEIISMLQSIGCSRNDVKRAKSNITNGELDCGLTYSNGRMRMSVMVISNTSSAKEFLDSLVHEIMHLSIHIANAEYIELTSEEVCYIGGDVARSLYPICKDLLCCECNHAH